MPICPSTIGKHNLEVIAIAIQRSCVKVMLGYYAGLSEDGLQALAILLSTIDQSVKSEFHSQNRNAIVENIKEGLYNFLL